MNLPRDLLQKTEIPEQSNGPWVIKKFEVTKDSADFYNMQQLFSGHGFQRSVREGHYTKLGKMVDEECGSLWMSDTPAEINDHYHPVKNAKGHCLIGGLGLGIIVEACLRHSEVTKVTVLELEPEIIEMVGGYLLKKWGKERLELIQADVLEWKPPKDAHYGMAWFDIWPSICQDNWDEMKLLHRRYGRKADWKGCWGREEIMRMNREDYRRRNSIWGW
jgi:hypothetical protein